MKTIYLAGGCFWGTEHFIRQFQGVLDTQVGTASRELAVYSRRSPGRLSSYRGKTARRTNRAVLFRR